MLLGVWRRGKVRRDSMCLLACRTASTLRRGPMMVEAAKGDLRWVVRMAGEGCHDLGESWLIRSGI